jgi:hypothetical protein
MYDDRIAVILRRERRLARLVLAASLTIPLAGAALLTALLGA